MIESIEKTIAHHRWAAENCDGKPRDEHLQMVAWLEELIELRVWNSEFGCSMHDYNRGVLKEPCLRLDYGFGEEWASVELGDGTGYVRLADYERLKAENANLREFAQAMADAAYEGQMLCDKCRFSHGCYNGGKKEHEGRGCQWLLWARELGIGITDA